MFFIENLYKNLLKILYFRHCKLRNIKHDAIQNIEFWELLKFFIKNSPSRNHILKGSNNNFFIKSIKLKLQHI